MPFISHYLQCLSYDDDSSIIWHSVFGRPMLVAKVLAEKLQEYAAKESLFVPEDIFGDDYAEDADILDTIKSLSDAHIIISSVFTEKIDLAHLYTKHNTGESKVKNLSLIMSEECPFRCKYCIHFANSKHYYNLKKMMTVKMAKASIDAYLTTVLENKLSEAYINFGGGEPLLNWKTIKAILPYIDDYRQSLGIPIKIGINTNLALLTKEIAKTLIKYDVEIAASLDGTKTGNDAVRLTKDLTGTYDQIIRGFKIMEDLGHPLDGFAMTVTQDNFFDIDTPIIDWAASLGMKEVRIDIDVIGAVNIPIRKIVTSLIKVRRYAKTKGISVIGFWSRPAENLGLIPEDEDVGFCGGERGNSLCVAPSGQVFPCGYSNYELGKYSEIINISEKPAYIKLLDRRLLSKLEYCQDCPILGFCRGGCMITREANPDTDKITRMCELYTAMTYEILCESVEYELST